MSVSENFNGCDLGFFLLPAIDAVERKEKEKRREKEKTVSGVFDGPSLLFLLFFAGYKMLCIVLSFVSFNLSLLWHRWEYFNLYVRKLLL